jgi:NAD(P)-dependent dehydrogenase (short-subunit alcohol dehydrogenase family)
MKRVVLVTGASSGIGRALVSYLAARDFDVVGSVRKESDRKALEAAGARSVLFDVRDERTVRAAAESLGEGGLDGLVNNAGIVVSGPLEFLPIEDVRRQLEVNLLGPIVVTQAFLPLLRRARGRIVNMSSISGRIAAPLLGPYAMSKFALEAFSDALRRELHSFGMHVSAIEPGAIRTPIWDKGLESARERVQTWPPRARELYSDLIEYLRTSARDLRDRAAPPERVARAVHHALIAKRPRTRYVVGRDARLGIRLASLLPDRVFDALMRRRIR